MEIQTVSEGEEEESFWQILGGKAAYPQFIEMPEPQPPRLFQVSDVSGELRIFEIPDWGQQDLVEEDLMLLDTYSQVFMWIGSRTSDTEQREAKNIAQKYVEACNDGRDVDTPILLIRSGQEPELFTCNFVGWETSTEKHFVDPYQAKLAEMRKIAAAAEAKQDAADAANMTTHVVPASTVAEPASTTPSPSATGTYSYEVLKNARPGDLPIDFKCKEEYLTSQDFQAVFSMPKADFDGLPHWKKINLKKAAGLF